MLEVNRLPQKHLRLLLDAEGPRRVERLLNVHRTTVRRWLDGTVQIPGAQHLAIRCRPRGPRPLPCGGARVWSSRAFQRATPLVFSNVR